MSLRRFLARHGFPGITPVFVFQMAKVGSSSLVEALEQRGLVVFHLHRMNREHLEQMRARRAALGWALPPPHPYDILGPRLRERVVNRRRPVKVITLVRDPIARNFSSYFEHLDAIWSRADAHVSVPLEDLHRGFIERFPHDEPLTWFDDELRPVFGVDVYQHPFPASGFLRINDVLVLKTELDDATKCAAVSEFLNLDDLVVRPTNVTADKSKGEAYRRFVSTLRLDPAIVDRMLESRYARHFYTVADRDAMRRKYLRL